MARNGSIGNLRFINYESVIRILIEFMLIEN